MRLIVFLAAAGLLLGCSSDKSGYSENQSAANESVQFVKASFNDASKQAMAKDKMMLLDFYAVW